MKVIAATKNKGKIRENEEERIVIVPKHYEDLNIVHENVCKKRTY